MPSFIGRSKEIAFASGYITRLMNLEENRDDISWPVILNFYGEPGVGKTTLIEYLLTLYREKFPSLPQIRLFEHDASAAPSTQFYNVLVRQIVGGKSFRQDHTTKIITNDGIFSFNTFEEAIDFTADKIGTTTAHQPYLIYADDCHFVRWNNHYIHRILQQLSRHQARILLLLGGNISLKKYFPTPSFGLYECQLERFSFEESKLFLNGFIAQFPDDTIKKIYAFTKGNPETLNFLMRLVKERQVPVEIILKEIITNEGRLIEEFHELFKENRSLKEEQAEVEHKVIATATHNLNQKFGILLNQFGIIKALIRKKEANEPLPFSLDDKLNEFYKVLLDATETFQTTAKVLDKQHLEPEKINLSDFFRHYIQPLHTGKKFTISIAGNEEYAALIDVNSFKDAITNLISNAEKHGFTNPDKQYEIIFEVADSLIEIADKKYVCIMYRNNGLPFPDGFTFDDFKQLTAKAGKHKGSGIGGYYINKVIELHQGKLRMMEPIADDDYPVQFEILIPYQA